MKEMKTNIPCDPDTEDCSRREWHAILWACCFEAHYFAEREAIVTESTEGKTTDD